MEYDYLLKDHELIRIFKNNYYEKVYDLLGIYVLKFDLDREATKTLRDRLFIEYMKFMSLKRKDNHVYEKVLIGMLEKYGFKDIIMYILNQNIDLDYEIINSKYKKISLINFLAIRIKDKDIMNLLLRKISNLDIFSFSSKNTKEVIDICIMNIIGNNLETAYKLFKQDNYILIREDVINLLKENYQIRLDDFDYTQDDKLYQIILAIQEANIDINSKKKILIAILKNKKVKLLNTKSLNIINEIFGEKLFNQFLEYLKESEILLYNISLNNEKVIYLDSIDYVTSKINLKK